MKTTICKKRRAICVLFLGVLFSLSAQQEKKTDSWVLASAVFKTEGSETDAAVLKSCAEIIPQLILEECAAFPSRLVTAEERSARVLFTWRTERNALYDKLSAQIKERDAAMLSSSGAGRRAKFAAADYEKKISDIRSAITANEESAAKASQAALAAGSLSLPVGLWGTGAEAAYEAKQNGVNPFADGVSGLITGTVSARGGFISVTAQLTIYPEGTIAATVADAGRIDDVGLIAKNLAAALFASIVNETPAILHLRVEPPAAAEKAVVRLNGTQFALSDAIEVPSGSHSLYVTSDGYESAHIRHTFEGGREYALTAAMKEAPVQEILFTSSDIAGDLFLQAVPQGKTPASVGVKGENILGEFFSETGESTFFQFSLPDTHRNPVAKLTLNLLPVSGDIAAEIEKSRKALYTTYGALLLSLPFSYLSYGVYVNAYNAWALGYGSESERDYWKTTSNITMGISIGCGVLMAVQLGRYLFIANKVIPRQIPVNSIKITY